jgi:hypothetical protein
LLSSPELLIYNIADQNRYMIHDKRNLSISMLFGSLLFLGMTAAMQSPMVIPASAQNMTNLSSTESESLGLITITTQQLKELENSMNNIREALEQGNITLALSNMTALEGQISVLAEET